MASRTSTSPVWATNEQLLELQMPVFNAAFETEKFFSLAFQSWFLFLLFNLSLLIFCHCFHIKCKHQKSWHKSHLRKYGYVANLNLWLIYCPLIVLHLEKYFKHNSFQKRKNGEKMVLNSKNFFSFISNKSLGIWTVIFS